jgi:hypothetical protein
MHEIRASLEEDIAELDRRVKELRGARHALTYDLEQALHERERQLTWTAAVLSGRVPKLHPRSWPR